MDLTDAPVSTAVELATLAIKAFRYFAGILRCGLVSMSGLFFIAGPSRSTQLYIKARIGAISKCRYEEEKTLSGTVNS